MMPTAACDQYDAAIGKMYGYLMPSAAAEVPKPGDVPGILSSVSFWVRAWVWGVP